MRKISLVIAMAVILTIGGVFATWTYPGAVNDLSNETVGVGISVQLGAADTLEVTDASLTVSVEPTGTGNYVPTIAKDGKIQVTFTPQNGSAYAESDLVVNWTATLNKLGKYNGTSDIFTSFDLGDGTLTFNGSQTVQEITAEDIEIAINSGFNWDTYEKYKLVDLSGCIITIEFEVPTTDAPPAA